MNNDLDSFHSDDGGGASEGGLSSDNFYGRTPAMSIPTFASQILRWLAAALGKPAQLRCRF